MLVGVKRGDRDGECVGLRVYVCHKNIYIGVQSKFIFYLFNKFFN